MNLNERTIITIGLKPDYIIITNNTYITTYQSNTYSYEEPSIPDPDVLLNLKNNHEIARTITLQPTRIASAV